MHSVSTSPTGNTKITNASSPPSARWPRSSAATSRSWATSRVRSYASATSTPFTPLPQEVQIGHRILINDGLVELVVIGVDEKRVTTRVIHGGPISSKKGMNFPDSELTIPAITEKDKRDVKFAVEQQLDYIAASFVRRKSDILDLRNLLHEAGGVLTGRDRCTRRRR